MPRNWDINRQYTNEDLAKVLETKDMDFYSGAFKTSLQDLVTQGYSLRVKGNRHSPFTKVVFHNKKGSVSYRLRDIANTVTLEQLLTLTSVTFNPDASTCNSSEQQVKKQLLELTEHQLLMELERRVDLKPKKKNVGIKKEFELNKLNITENVISFEKMVDKLKNKRYIKDIGAIAEGKWYNICK